MQQTQTFLGFDFGTKKIGVAIGQTLTKSATPLECLQAKAGEPNWRSILNLISKWQPQALVVGIPINMNGTSQAITDKAKEFAQHLREKTNLPVHEVDERLTTVEAKQLLFELGGYKALKTISVDSYAAKLILEAWMRT